MRTIALLLAGACTAAGALSSGLSSLAEMGDYDSRRASTWDVTGGNTDCFTLTAGGVRTIMDVTGAGCIRHCWFTCRADDPLYLSKLRLRMFWDGAEAPSVDVPLGDFFLLGHNEVADVDSLPIAVVTAPHKPRPPGNAAFNCYFPMPFAKGALVTIEYAGEGECIFYAQIDYEAYGSSRSVANLGRFHADYRTEVTEPAGEPANIGGKENYVVLDVTGSGRYVGCCLSVVSRPSDPGKWWEGDDMIFVDGAAWPPTLAGTGTEDYFSLAWGFRREVSRPYFGCSYRRQSEGDGYFNGRFTCYRFHVLDAVRFHESIRVSLEHGHANDAGNVYSSVAYYYLER